MLLRYDPFRDVDRFFEQARAPRPTPSMAMDAVRTEHQLIARFDLPGVDPESIDIEVERNSLTIKAERRWDRTEGEQVLAAERRHGSFARQLILGDNLDTGAIEAGYTDGVLTITIPVAQTAKPRKVAVGTGPAPALDAAEVPAEEQAA